MSHYSNRNDDCVAPLVIFDCDGVLVDSEPIAASVISSLLIEENINLTPTECESIFSGYTMDSVVEWIKDNYSISLSKSFISRCHIKTLESISNELQPIRGIKTVLDTIRNPICVASNGELKKVTHSLRSAGLSKYFGNSLFCIDHVSFGKPHPDLFLYAAEVMGYKPENTIVIEDSLTGVRAAVAAGMGVFGYVPEEKNNARFFRRELSLEGAEIFSKMVDLPGLIK